MIFKQTLRKQVMMGVSAFVVLALGLVAVDYFSLSKTYLLAIVSVFVLFILHYLRSRVMFNVEVTDTYLLLRTGDKKSDVSSVLLANIESIYLRTVPKAPTVTHIKECDVYLEVKCLDGTILELPYNTHGKHFHSMINLVIKGHDELLYDTVAKQPREGFNRVLSEVMQGKIHPQPFLENTYIGHAAEGTNN